MFGARLAVPLVEDSDHDTDARSMENESPADVSESEFVGVEPQDGYSVDASVAVRFWDHPVRPTAGEWWDGVIRSRSRRGKRRKIDVYFPKDKTTQGIWLSDFTERKDILLCPSVDDDNDDPSYKETRTKKRRKRRATKT